MARFSEEELDEIRRNTDIVTLIESYGTKLKERPTPNEYVGCCPLHDDETPSLFVNRAKGVWQCKGACGIGGDCFRWVMKAEKVSFVASVELSKANAVGRLAGNGTKAAYVRRLENPMSFPSQHKHLSHLKSYFSWLARHNHILFNPASELELPKIGHRLTMPRHSDEVHVRCALTRPKPNRPGAHLRQF